MSITCPVLWVIAQRVDGIVGASERTQKAKTSGVGGGAFRPRRLDRISAGRTGVAEQYRANLGVCI